MRYITREDLEERLTEEKPEDDRSAGYVLVNVLSHERFLDEHIPGSINIALGNEDEFERRYAKDKEVIVYSASPRCSASTKVAEELEARGFANIVKYEGGMSDWTQAGDEVERGASIHEMPIA